MYAYLNLKKDKIPKKSQICAFFTKKIPESQTAAKNPRSSEIIPAVVSLFTNYKLASAATPKKIETERNDFLKLYGNQPNRCMHRIAKKLC